MRTVGEIIKESRVAKGYTLVDVERATRIRVKFLEAIEHDDYRLLPSLSYAKGFVKNYCTFLRLDSEKMLAFFRRQTEEVTKASLLPPRPKLFRRTFLQLTPAKFLSFLALGIVGGFFFYFYLQYQTIQRAPILTVDHPTEGQVVSENKVEVLGKTENDATVTINGISVLVRSDGKFFDQVGLDPGTNTIELVATSRFGKQTTMHRTVVHQ